MPELTALDLVLLELAGGRPVAWRGAQAVDGAGFLARVGAWHATLAQSAGNTIALAHGDAIEFAAALYAAWLRGLNVLVPGDTLPATVASIAKDVTDFVGDFGAATTQPVPEADVGHLVPNLRERDGSLGTQCATPGSLMQALPLGLASSLILQTSGSTGTPLRVHKSLRQLDTEVRALECCFGATLGDARIAATVSHQHIYGLLFRLLWPLASRRPFEARAHAYLESVAPLQAHGPLALVASPAHLKRIPPGIAWKKGGIAGTAPSASSAPEKARALTAIFCSGGALDFGAAQAVLAATGTLPTEIWGSTETGGIGWRRQFAADTPFQLFPELKIDVNDGQLRLRSPYLADGEWRALADRGEIDAAGRVHLRGRDDRIVKIEEKRVSLTAIERAAGAGRWLVGARVVAWSGERLQLGLVGIPNERARELLLASGRRVLAAELRAELAEHCERIALPRRFRFIGAFPCNDQGKTTDVALAALFADTESRPLLPFHEWTLREPRRAGIQLWIGPDLYHFQGHFPGQPILPGVAQLDWAITLARQAFALPANLERIETLKFQAPIQPGTRLHLDLEWKPDRRLLEFRAHSAAGPHASARLVFAER